MCQKVIHDSHVYQLVYFVFYFRGLVISKSSIVEVIWQFYEIVNLIHWLCIKIVEIVDLIYKFEQLTLVLVFGRCFCNLNGKFLKCFFGFVVEFHFLELFFEIKLNFVVVIRRLLYLVFHSFNYNILIRLIWIVIKIGFESDFVYIFQKRGQGIFVSI